MRWITFLVLINLGMLTILNAQHDTLAGSFDADIEQFSNLIYDANPDSAFAYLKPWIASPLSCQERIKLNNKIGVYYDRIGNSQKALVYIRDSTLRLQQSCLDKSDPSFANTYFNLGVFYQYEFSDPAKAKYYYDQCVDHLETYNEAVHENSAFYYQYIGQFVKSVGDPERALNYLSKANDLHKSKSDTSSLVNSNYILSLIYQDLGQDEKALANLHYSLKLIREAQDLSLEKDYSYRLNYALAQILYLQDSIELASHYVQKSTVESKAANRKKAICAGLALQALIALKQDKPNEALELIELSKSYAVSPLQKAFATENTGEVYFKLGKFDEAENYVQKALRILVPQLEDSYDIAPSKLDAESINTIVRLIGLMSKARYHNGQDKDYQAALRYALIVDSLNFSLMNDRWMESSKQRHLESSIENYQWGIKSGLELLEFDPNQASKVYRLIAQPKAHLLRELTHLNIKYRQILPDSSFFERRGLLQSIQKTIAQIQNNYETLNPSELDSLNARVHDQNRAIEKFDEALFKRHPDLFESNSLNALTLAEVQNELDSESLLIEYFYLDGSLFQAFIDRDTAVFNHVNIRPEVLQELIADTKNGTANSHASIDLSKKLIDKIQEFPEKKKLIIVPDGLLSQLAFESLVQQNGHFLVEDYDVSYHYTNNIDDKSDKQLRVEDMLLMANNYTEAFRNPASLNVEIRAILSRLGPLPDATEEVERISVIFGSSAYTDNNATKEVFLEKILGAQVVHLAMHGFLDEAFADQSGILFEPLEAYDASYLSASEVYNLNLETDLVVLSSCHSGQGDIKVADAPRSLARSFLAAGSGSVLISLWQASDSGSEETLSRFYNYLRSGLSKSAALSQAKRDYLKHASPSARDPQYWAHLVLIGDDQPIIFVAETSNLQYLFLGLLLVGLLIFFWKKSKN